MFHLQTFQLYKIVFEAHEGGLAALFGALSIYMALLNSNQRQTQGGLVHFGGTVVTELGLIHVDKSFHSSLRVVKVIKVQQLISTRECCLASSLDFSCFFYCWMRQEFSSFEIVKLLLLHGLTVEGINPKVPTCDCALNYPAATGCMCRLVQQISSSWKDSR